ncbi:MAG: diguanylate cyclase [Burkholderiaceae bacterium]|nr:diguanylate cyclase [Burkholderiaceae bacterium]
MNAHHLLYLVLAVQLAFAGIGWWVAGKLLGLARETAFHMSVFCLCSLATVTFTLQIAGSADLSWIALSNFAIVASFVALGRGMRVFLKQPRSPWLDGGVLLAAMAMGVFDVTFGANPFLRGALIAAIAASVLLRSGVSSARPIAREFGRAAAALVSGLLVSAGLIFAGRIAVAWSLWRAAGTLLISVPTGMNQITVVSLTSMLSLFNLMLGAMAVMRVMRRLQRVVRRLQHLAQHDTLTGLANLRSLIHVMSAELARVQRGGSTWALLMLDIDHFKQVNDRYGHAAGDEALRQAARLLRETARPSDTVARTGGEEFCVLAPDTDLDGAARLAERLRHAIAAAPVGARKVNVTISIGVTTALPGAKGKGETVQQAMARADAALYRAKAAGRNRVELAHGEDSEDASEADSVSSRFD